MEVLFRVPADRAGVPVDHRAGGARPVAGDAGDQGRARYADPATGARADLPADAQLRPARNLQIGRASCRDRVCQYVSISVVAGSLKKTQTNSMNKQIK